MRCGHPSHHVLTFWFATYGIQFFSYSQVGIGLLVMTWCLIQCRAISSVTWASVQL